MNRNLETRFAINPTIEAPRSVFNMSKKHLTTFNVADLVPIYNKLIYPGDTVSMNTRMVVRTTTPIKAPMDTSYLDTYWFYVPLRLVWNHFKEFMGENKLTPWEQPTEYEIPQIVAPESGWQKGTIAEQMGAPMGVGNISLTALKYRAYALIWQEWFRDQNLQDGTMINLDETTQIGVNTGNYVTDLQLGGKMAKVNKFHDYFTSCLPSPQKGPEVTIPLGTSAPVRMNTTADSTNLVVGSYDERYNIRFNTTGSFATSNVDYVANTGDVNLVTDLSLASSATLTAVRQAFAVKQLYEAFARGGTRYREIIQSTFGVSSSDARVQVPEYLGGKRISMNINQVVQMSETTNTSPQGNIAGFSLTCDEEDSFTKSFEEHGYLIGLACVRTNHTYQQGIPREDSIKNKLEMFWPQFEGIGDQAVLNKEIRATGTEEDEKVFGYQERYAELKTDFNTVAGEFRSNYAQTLDVWHYADYYTEQPVLGPEWIQETPVNMDRTLQVTSAVSDQIHGDFYFECKYVRRMNMYGIPGLTRM